MSKRGVLESVAATAKAEEVWLQSTGDYGNDSHSNHDYVVWRYIASSVGIIRIYPGTQLDTTGLKASHQPWSVLVPFLEVTVVKIAY